MSTRDKVKNMTQITKGKIKKSAGRSTGDTQLEEDGSIDQMKGNVKQAGEKIKGALRD